LLFGSYAAGLIVATPLFGVVSDKLGSRKAPLLLSLVLLTVATIIFGLSRSLVLLFIARIAQGVSAAGSWVIGLALVAEVFVPSEHGSAMGVVSALNSVGLLVGPPLGGLLYQHFNYATPFFVCSAVSLLNLVFQALFIPAKDEIVRRCEESTHCEDTNSLSTTQEIPKSSSVLSIQEAGLPPPSLTIVSMLTYPEVISTLYLVVMYSAAFSGIEPVLPLYLADRYHSSPTEVGGLYFVIVLAYIGVSFISGKLSDTWGPLPLMNLGSLVLCLVTPLMAIPARLGWQIVTFALFGSATAIVSTPIMAFLSLFVDAHGGGAFAQMYALYLMAYSFGMLLGPIGAGFLMQNANFFWTTIFFSLLQVSYLPALYLTPKFFSFFRFLKERLRCSATVTTVDHISHHCSSTASPV